MEVDITKPLLTQFRMKKRVRRIEYEGIHLVCFGCGVVGHRKEDCTAKPPGNTSENQHAAEADEEMNVNGEGYERQAKITKETDDGFPGNERSGPWMLAKKKERNLGKNRQNKMGNKDGNTGNGGKSTLKNSMQEVNKGIEIQTRFNALYGLEEGEEEVMENGNERPNKEDGIERPILVNEITEKQAQRRKPKKKAMPAEEASNPLPDLNEVDFTHEENSEKGNGDSEEKEGSVRKQSQRRSKQAAAETEHVVIRGSDKGKNIVRTVVVEEEDGMDVTSDGFNEHHQDPPGVG